MWKSIQSEISETRMHSSRMRTARTTIRGGGVGWVGMYLVLGGCTWSRGGTWSWGVYLVLGGGVPGPMGCTWSQGDVPGPGGGVPGPGGTLSGTPPPLWTEWQTGVKILPCPRLRLRAVISTCDLGLLQYKWSIFYEQTLRIQTFCTSFPHILNLYEPNPVQG